MNKKNRKKEILHLLKLINSKIENLYEITKWFEIQNANLYRELLKTGETNNFFTGFLFGSLVIGGIFLLMFILFK